MIILITGKPGAGKSTLIDRLISLNKNPVHWVVTKEIRSRDGERVGFKSINDRGQELVISHKHDIELAAVIGQNKVNLDAVDKMFANIAVNALGSKTLTIIDEIGPIQLLSKHFCKSLKQVFEDPRSIQLVATIHQNDKQLTKYREATNLLLVQVNDDNRDALPANINSVLAHSGAIDSLKPKQFKRFRKLATDYIEGNVNIQLGKLLNNALSYVNEHKVKGAGLGKYTVLGKHDKHSVTRSKSNYACDCDLFNGRGIYTNKAGVCSHIQAVTISY